MNVIAIAPMSPVALYFASGESLYIGAALLLAVVAAATSLKRTCIDGSERPTMEGAGRQRVEVYR